VNLRMRFESLCATTSNCFGIDALSVGERRNSCGGVSGVMSGNR
jgi:hypothetical protein